MSNYNEDYVYASEKLPGTIVRLKDGNPVYVQNVFVRDKVCDVQTIDKLRTPYKLKLKDLDLRSPPLGFANYRDMAIYVSRIPKRRDWRQGIRTQNCFVGDGIFMVENLLDGNALHNCIVGKYPKINSILNKIKRVNKLKLRVAWDRHWALDNKLNVFYKNWGVVGVFDVNKMDVVFNDHCSFLRESFEESVR